MINEAEMKTLITSIGWTVFLVSIIIEIWSGESFISWAWKEEIEKGVSKRILYFIGAIGLFTCKIYLTTFLIYANKYNIKAVIKFFCA